MKFYIHYGCENPWLLDFHWLQSNTQNKQGFQLSITHKYSLFRWLYPKHFSKMQYQEKNSKEISI